jgi:Arc/MetJ-type ribon-helix-helix transcriptional regulator
MITTINVSMPTDFYTEIKKLAKSEGFVSVSEAVRFALRKVFLREELTENGFSPAEEKYILKIAKEPSVPGLVLKPGDDVDKFFEKMLQKGRELNAAEN